MSTAPIAVATEGPVAPLTNAAAPEAAATVTLTVTATATPSPVPGVMLSEGAPSELSPEAEPTASPLAVAVTPAEATGENAFAKFYKTPKGPEKAPSSTPKQIARLAWVAPVAAIAIASLTAPLRHLYPGAMVIIDGANGCLLLIGLMCAAVGLSTAKRTGRDGVLLPSAAGLFACGAFVGLAAAWVMLAPKPPQAVASAPEAEPSASSTITTIPVRPSKPRPSAQQGLADAAKAGRDAIGKYAGWYGAATAKGATICVGEFAAAAPEVEEIRGNFDAHPTLLLIALDNSRGHAPLSIDPSSVRAESADGRRVLALPVHTVLETAREDRDKLMTLFNRLLQADPGQQATYGFAFLPAETDLRGVSRVSLVLNGKRVALPGKYLSADQKAELARRAEAQASR